MTAVPSRSARAAALAAFLWTTAIAGSPRLLTPAAAPARARSRRNDARRPPPRRRRPESASSPPNGAFLPTRSSSPPKTDRSTTTASGNPGIVRPIGAPSCGPVDCSSTTRLRFRLFEDDDGNGAQARRSLPGWVRSLLKWQSQPNVPKLMHMPPPTIEEERDALEEASSLEGRTPASSPSPNHVPVPLASLINVEALLMASGEDGVHDEFDDIAPFFGSVVTRGTKGNDSPSATMTEGSATSREGTTDKSVSDATPFDLFPSLENIGDWDRLVRNLQRSVGDAADAAESISAAADLSPTLTEEDDIDFDFDSATHAAPLDPFLLQAAAADSVLRDVTSHVASFLDDTTTSLGPSAVRDLVIRASNTLETLEKRSGGLREAADEAVRAAERMAIDGGLDVTEAVKAARETTRYTEELVRVANGVLVGGYVMGDGMGTPTVANPLHSRPLFHDFPSARPVTGEKDRKRAILKAAEMAKLAGAVYEKDTQDGVHKAGHALVKRDTTADVAWMVTDSIGYEDDYRGDNDDTGIEPVRTPIMIRTITIRGFDASDDTVDRERILNGICTADPVPLGDFGVSVHRGLLAVAKSICDDVSEYVDHLAPGQRVVLNGHSIGGSLGVLVLMLLAEKRGADYVRDKVLRVFTFGSPPVSVLTKNISGAEPNGEDASSGEHKCEVLRKFGLPADMVYGYVQPWDPIVRLFSSADALYPLVGDIGEDGKTLWSSGPKRALRPIARAIIESWEGWSRFRDCWGPTGQQSYISTGVQHIVLPEPVRYLTDRLVGANVAIPPVEAVVRISSEELLPGLERTHPLDVFAISFVPAALRSFIHHFYPAYADAFVEYAAGIENDKKKPGRNKKAVHKKKAGPPLSSGGGGSTSVRAETRNMDGMGVEEEMMKRYGRTDGVAAEKARKSGLPGIEWAEASAQWILGGNKFFGDERGQWQ